MASENAGNTLTRPLLGNFSSSDLTIFITPSAPKDGVIVSLDALENGRQQKRIAELRHSKSLWDRLLMAVRKRRNDSPRGGEELDGVKLKAVGVWRRKGFLFKVAWRVPVALVLFFGIVHIINVSMSSVYALRDNSDPIPFRWRPSKQFREGGEVELNGLTRDITPIHCHSHNDYWRQVPLYDALRWGCTGVEADVWLFDNDLFVGHNTNTLTRRRTFRSMYVDPLLRILDHQNSIKADFVTSTQAAKNGVYEMDPKQTLVLLVDFKNDGHAIYPFVSEQLAAFRSKGYLSYFNGNATVPGPITVVATGNAPFDLITADSAYRDIFFDAPLDRMYEEPTSLRGAIDVDFEIHRHSPPTTPALSSTPERGGGQGTVGTDASSHFDLTNAYYASTNFGKSIGWLWFGRISEAQIKRIRGQVQGAKRRGLKARYWNTPDWPIGLRNKVWRVLVEEGVDYLNGDDLRAMTSVDWVVKKHWGWLG